MFNCGYSYVGMNEWISSSVGQVNIFSLCLPFSVSAVLTTVACVWRLMPSSATSWMEWDLRSLLGDKRWQRRPWVRGNLISTIFSQLISPQSHTWSEVHL